MKKPRLWWYGGFSKYKVYDKHFKTTPTSLSKTNLFIFSEAIQCLNLEKITQENYTVDFSQVHEQAEYV